MRHLRLLAAFPLFATCVFAHAQGEKVLGKVGEATDSTDVYTHPNTNSKILCHVQSYERLVIRHSKYEQWDLVVFRNGHMGYVPAIDIAELPYIYVSRPRSRVSQLSSRGGSQILPSGAGNKLTEYAMTYQGTPYEWGGNSLSNGVDCSGFVKQVMAGTIGTNLPRTAAEQALVGKPLMRMEELQPGDRLYFKQKSDTKISHTGIYLGDGFFIHSSHGKGKVTTDSLLKPGWRNMLVAARR